MKRFQRPFKVLLPSFFLGTFYPLTGLEVGYLRSAASKREYLKKEKESSFPSNRLMFKKLFARISMSKMPLPSFTKIPF